MVKIQVLLARHWDSTLKPSSTRDVKAVLMDDMVYEAAIAEAFPKYNKTHMISLRMPETSGEVLITKYGELDEFHYLDPRTAQVVTVDHVKQECTNVRPADNEELPSAYIEAFRSALDDELLKFVSEHYPKGACSVYCTGGKDVEAKGSNFELVAVISAARHSPQNFCNGIWRSVWKFEFQDDQQAVEVRGKIEVASHYFEEGNVQMAASNEFKDATMFQSVEDSAVALTNIVRDHETKYLEALEGSYANLPDYTFKDLRRKLPVTRTLFQWHNPLQFNLARDLGKELGNEK